jgi:hypothetical protein
MALITISETKYWGCARWAFKFLLNSIKDDIPVESPLRKEIEISLVDGTVSLDLRKMPGDQMELFRTAVINAYNDLERRGPGPDSFRDLQSYPQLMEHFWELVDLLEGRRMSEDLRRKNDPSLTRFQTGFDIDGENYLRLLNHAERISTFFLLVLQAGRDLNTSGRQILVALEPFLDDPKAETGWPGSKWVWRTARVYRYRMEGGARAVLEMNARSVFEWAQPKRPADLSFLRADGSAWFFSHPLYRWSVFELLDYEMAELSDLVHDLYALPMH